MSTDDAPETQEQEPSGDEDSASPRSAVQEGSRPSPASNVPADEAKLEAPSQRALLMLGAISLSTLIMWGAGRAACNYYVAGEGLTPRAVTIEEKTQHPKDVALEFALALTAGRFTDAEKLAAGEALEGVKKEAQSCGACAERKALAEKLLAVPVVTKANTVAGLVRVTLSGSKSGVLFLLVERLSNSWKVTRTFADDKALPALPDPPPPLGQGPLLP